MSDNNLTIIEKEQAEIIRSLVLDSDLSKMKDTQKVEYYNKFCQSLGLNPLTQPFQLIKFQGKERLYATKDCTEQLRKIHGVSIESLSHTEVKDSYIVTATAKDRTGKTDAATGVVSISSLKGDALANAIMKAETKAKRRVTLSICGLGMLDETELETVNTGDISAKISIEQKIVELPEELKAVIAEADMKNLAAIYKENSEYHSNPEFMRLLSERKNKLKELENLSV